MKIFLSLLLISTFTFVSCKKKGCTDPTAVNYSASAKSDDGSCTYAPEAETGPYLIIKLKFDSTQPRLDNFGNPATIPAGHSAQSPTYFGMSAHYIELAQNQFTQLGQGSIIYHGAETTAGGSNAVDFSKAIIKSDGQVFLKVPLSQIPADTYNWVRMSLTYQNYNLKFKWSDGNTYTGRLASFVGFNTFITNVLINTQTLAVNQNKLQGFWAFENMGFVVQGQTSGTTVVNPLASTSPVPAGSCVVTGNFDTPFTITGTETQDIECVMSLSTNNSFEWVDQNSDGLYEPSAGDYPVDMGLRGLKPSIVP